MGGRNGSRSGEREVGMGHDGVMNGVNTRHMTLVTGLCNSSVSVNISLNKTFMKYYPIFFC